MRSLIFGVLLVLCAGTADAFNMTIHQLPKDPRNPFYSEAEVQVAVELVQKHYGELITRDVDVFIVEKGLLSDNIGGYYDFRGPMILIKVGVMKTAVMRIYILAHELGHHVMATWQTNDHCLMYQDDGFDHKILNDLGVENPYDDYINPFATLFVCGDEGY